VKLRPAWNVTRHSVLMSLGFAACLMVSIVGVWVLANATMPQQVPSPAAPLHLALRVVEDGKVIEYSSNQSRNNTAFSLLLEAARDRHFEVAWENWTVPSESVLVTSIDGLEGGDGGRWWQYWVNDAYGTVGADHAQLHDGDVVEWRFTTYSP